MCREQNRSETLEKTQMTPIDRHLMLKDFEEMLQRYLPDAKPIYIGCKYQREILPPYTRRKAIAAFGVDEKGELTIEYISYFEFLEADDQMLEEWLPQYVPDPQGLSDPARITKTSVGDFINELIKLQNGEPVVVVMPCFPSFLTTVGLSLSPNVRALINTPSGMSDTELNLTIEKLTTFALKNSATTKREV